MSECVGGMVYETKLRHVCITPAFVAPVGSVWQCGECCTLWVSKRWRSDGWDFDCRWGRWAPLPAPMPEGWTDKDSAAIIREAKKKLTKKRKRWWHV